MRLVMLTLNCWPVMDEVTKLFVVGPQRAGTTWIYNLLATQDSGVYMDRLEKENYFVNKFSHDEPRVLRRRYLKRMMGNGPPMLGADVCPVYFGDAGGIEVLNRAFPDALFVAVQRDRGSRADSFMAHRHVNKFGAQLLRWAGDPLYVGNSHFERQSRYDQGITHLLDTVGAERFLALSYEDLVTDGGSRWSEQLSNFTGLELHYSDQGLVNASRSSYSVPRRVLLGGLRVLQHLRFHIPLRKLKARSFQSLWNMGFR